MPTQMNNTKKKNQEYTRVIRSYNYIIMIQWLM